MYLAACECPRRHQAYVPHLNTQQTRYVHPMLLRCWATVCALAQHKVTFHKASVAPHLTAIHETHSLMFTPHILKNTPIGEVQRFSAPNCQLFSEIFHNIDWKKGRSVQFMSNIGAQNNSVYLTSLHRCKLHRKVEYISQTNENSFCIPPQNYKRFHSYVIFSIYLHIYVL